MRKRFLPLLAALALLSACSETRDFMGLTNKPPDEFAVVDNPPLSMPPDYNLAPPRPGAASKQALNPGGTAAKALYGDGQMEIVQQQGVNSLNMQGLSSAEQVLVSQSGSDKADPRIRGLVDREATQQVVGNRKLVDYVLFWRDPKTQEKGTIVDPAAERQRLEQAQRQGQPVTSGATPATEKNNNVMVQ